MIAKRGRGRKTWLEALVRDGKLHIVIGVETLAFAAQGRFDENAFQASDGQQERAEFCIGDPDTFASEVVRALTDEAEDGTNRMHLMFDDAFDHLSAHGADGITDRTP
jgi:hypothetical protein